MTKSTITRERLEKIASGNAWVCVQDDEAAELARMALAALDSEPVGKPFMYGIADPDGNAYIDEFCVSEDLGLVEDAVTELNYDREEGDELCYSAVPLYLHAQPVPVVPDEMYWQDAPVDGSTRAAAYATGWNACRAAMLAAAQQEGK